MLEQIARKYGVKDLNVDRLMKLTKKVFAFYQRENLSHENELLEQSSRLFSEGDLDALSDALLLATMVCTEHDLRMKYPDGVGPFDKVALEESEIDTEFAILAHEAILAGFFIGLDSAESVELVIREDNKPMLKMMHMLLDSYGVGGSGEMTAQRLSARLENWLLPEYVAQRRQLNALKGDDSES